ncbi:hypothetical protein [Microbacterium mangrovi]|uniref:hypothetical protein n=1 Tax=Microbacterium mangrovi TaxID=1348253 RepID=UPI00069017AB|nr:hypothetical protein [Microbacterium mangrovi]
MAELDKTAESGLNRRTVIKGAAWSIPVVAAAVATPLAAASVTNSSLAWTSTQSGLLTLQLLSGGGTATAGVAITLPDEFTLTNGAGALNANATVTIVVGKPTAGVNVTLGTARGFGVYKLNGVVVSGQNNAAYTGGVGYPTTTFTQTGVNFTAASNGAVVIPVEFGLSGTHTTPLALNLLTTFPVTLTVDFGGTTYTATTTISVPIGAGIL